MLAILRILFGFALFALLGKAVEVAGPTAQTEGTTDAGYLAVAVFLAIANAVVWAPWVGRLMADPMTGAFTSGSPADFKNPVLQFAHKLALRRWRRMAVCFAFLDGIRHPDLPGAFVLGMNQARPGTWLEKVFAREVWRFENAEHCLRAWKILQRHGVEPDMHPKAEVHLLLLAQRREVPPPPGILTVPPAPPPPRPIRNPGIRIFERAGPSGAASAEAPSATGTPQEPEALAAAEPLEPPSTTTGGAVAGSRADASPGLAEAEAMVSVGGPARNEAPATAGNRHKLGWGQRLKVLWTGTLDD